MHVPEKTGIVLVDHGSRVPEANAMLDEVATRFAQATGAAIVEPAHMELAEPTIAQAFDRCVERGAAIVVIQPYFLSPGRHSTEDIPRIAAKAAERHPDIPWRVGDALGVDSRMNDIILRRVLETLAKM